jgi:hypothetical protein
MRRVAVLTRVGFGFIVFGWAVWGTEQNACDSDCHTGGPVFIVCAAIGVAFLVGGGYAVFSKRDDD